MEIKQVKVTIDVKHHVTRYGFIYDFSSGLNIITGQNSSGKSTIVSCIYYCLGMEQLLGGNRSLVLDKSLFEEFEYDNKTLQITNSYAELKITNGLRKATLKRYIKSFNNENINKIVVVENNSTSSYYLHAGGDHDRPQGFYNWLTKFLGIVLPIVHDDNSDQSNALYLQNIFPCALIEQTKGWSDFFAQMPNFGIKDSKQKLVEFLLRLESLDNEIRKDILLQREKNVKEEWAKRYLKINERATSQGFSLRGIYPDLIKNDLKGVSFSSLDILSEESRNWVNLKEYISFLTNEHSGVVREIKSEESSNTPDNIKNSQLKLQSEITLLNRQLRVTNSEKIKERKKIDGYIEEVNKIDVEIERLDSAIKLDRFMPNADDLILCPVCDHELDVESKLKINSSKISLKDSISFLKSQRNLYDIYIKKYNELDSNFNEVSYFLSNEIYLKKEEIKNLRKDISSSQNKNIRTLIFKEITLIQKINENIKLLKEFTKVKDELKDILVDFSDIKDEKAGLKVSDERDNIKISNFIDGFKKLLGDKYFYYTSNDIKHIAVQNKNPSRLLPVVNIRGNVQPIRLSSSASDFIRAQWAFYLTLLESSDNHPGFLVMDEPGQHAMNVESMSALLIYSSLTKKQIIMCISKDTRNKTETANLSKILSNLGGGNKYNLIDIDPDEKKCVRPL
ncbi:hypothetical protein ACIPUN_03095 [Pectobacterium sp. CHL-2024]|uniref:hypothetical protein n=1 Tax=Pectobacterium sp. CHL-2024 TaxID=3377079 RepID=UPI00382C3495